MIKYGSNNIGKIYIGSTQIGKAYFGSNLVYGGSGPSPIPLPSGYTKLTYVETPLNTQAYIDTGIIATDDIGFYIDALTYDNNTHIANEFGCLFGGRAGSNSSDYQLSTYTAQNSGFSGTLRLGGSTENSDAGLPVGTRFVATLDGNNYQVDGNSSTVSLNIGSGGENIYLFALNTNGTAEQFSHARVYRFKLTDAGVKVLDLVPCRRESDNLVGFYDLVNSSFVAPTSGDLYGVDETNTSYDSAVDYIEFNGNQGVNVGVGVDVGNTNVEIQCQVTGNLSSTQIIVGPSANSGQWFGNVSGTFAVGSGSAQILSSSSVKTDITVSYLASQISITDGTKTGVANRNATPTLPIYIGQAGPSGGYNASVRVWYIKVYDGNTLIRDMIPVIKGGVGYFYDSITGLLFGSSTGTPLIAGTD